MVLHRPVETAGVLGNFTSEGLREFELAKSRVLGNFCISSGVEPVTIVTIDPRPNPLIIEN
jgi:hypothetical protein